VLAVPALRLGLTAMARLSLREVGNTYAALRLAHPAAHCELAHENPFQLLVATVLSAQATDVSVNQVTPALFRRWPAPEALATAELSHVEQALNRLGMFRQKAKNITGLARRLVEEHNGSVPPALEVLVRLPGVGRKTANVVLGVAFGLAEGVVVDTHVQRLAQRLGWTRHETPEKIEADLMKLFPREDWTMLSHTLIFHGRRICTARSPQCLGCPIAQRCPSAFKAEHVGRKAVRPRTAADKSALGARPTGSSRPRPARIAKKVPAQNISGRPRSSA
jgi:endonuclease-3